MAAPEILQGLNEYLVKEDDFDYVKSIGKGGYGEVFLAIHRTTSTKCAVKRLITNNLEGAQLTYFCREVMILAQCNNFFLLPFLGFTSTAPYLIVTEYIPNGSLFDSLRKKPGAPSLTPTNKTLIAMGIASGMADLHHRNIIHRDLKSLNILLDEKLLPKICDFGIARYVGDDNIQVTAQIGTPHWMAPELYDVDPNHPYTNKVDVYSYGILLWEIASEEIPFRGMQAMQVALAVTRDHKRPAMPPDIEPGIKKLINACWDQDPDRRPTFDEILKYFSEGKGSWQGTDPKAVEQMCQFIKQTNTTRELGIYDENNPGPLNSIFRTNHNSTGSTPAFNFINEMKNFRSPNYEQICKNALSQLNDSNALSFFETAAQLMSAPPTVPLFISSIVAQVLIRNPQYVDAFLSSGMIDLLLYHDRDAITPNFHILISIAHNKPQAINSQHLTRALEMISIKDEKDTKGAPFINFLSEFITSGKDLPGICTLLLPVLQGCSNLVLTSFSAQFFQVCSWAMAEVPGFLDTCGSATIALGKYAVENSRNIAGIKAAYTLLLQAEKVLDISLTAVVKHLGSRELAFEALSVLARHPELPASKRLVTALFKCVHNPPETDENSKIASYLLCRVADNQKGASLLLSPEHAEWLQIMTAESGLKVLITIATHSELRPQLMRTPPVTGFFARVCETKDPILVKATCTIIRRLPLDPMAVTDLMNARYVSNLVDAIIRLNDRDLLYSGILLVDCIARQGFSPDFLKLIPNMVQMMEEGNEMGLPALSLSIVLVELYPETEKYFREARIPDLVKNMKLPTNYETYRLDFIQHFQI